MPNKPIELPPKVAQAFVRDMRAFFKAKNQLKQDEIAPLCLSETTGQEAPADEGPSKVPSQPAMNREECVRLTLLNPAP